MRAIGPWSSSIQIPRSNVWSYVTGNGTKPPTLKGAELNTWTESDDRSGYNSGPGWRERLAAGSLSPTPMRRVRQHVAERDADAFSMIYSKTYAEQPWPRYPYYIGDGAPAGHYLSTTTLNSIFGNGTADVSQRALASLFQKIAGTQFDSLTFLGELKETQTMLRSGTTLLAKTILNHEGGLRSQIAKGKFRNLSAVRDLACDSWLQLQYGIKPLIGDVSNAIDAYAHASSLLEVVHLKGHASQRWSKSYPVTALSSVIGPNGIPLKVTCTDTRVAKATCGVTANVDLLYSSNPNWGLTWNNVLPAMWELIPYSFLLDYFTNIGDVIQAYTAPRAGLSKYWMTTSVEDSRSYGSASWNHSLGATTRYEGYFRGGKTRAFSVVRSTSGAPPMPSLRFSSWDSLSLTKQVSVGALLTQFASRRMSSFGFLAKLLR